MEGMLGSEWGKDTEVDSSRKPTYHPRISVFQHELTMMGSFSLLSGRIMLLVIRTQNSCSNERSKLIRTIPSFSQIVSHQPCDRGFRKEMDDWDRVGSKTGLVE